MTKDTGLRNRSVLLLLGYRAETRCLCSVRMALLDWIMLSKIKKTAIFLPDYDDDITFRDFYRLAAMQLEKIDQEE